MPWALPRPGKAPRSGSVGGTGRLGAAPGAMLDIYFTGKLLLRVE